MRTLVRRVGRLQRLGVFESAARLGSFTAAAAELGTSQPAVTQQIRALEADLDLTLFVRTANRATLSDAGRRLLRSVGQAFTEIETEVDRLSAPSVFVLAANPGIAQRWLVPYLDGLQAAIGDLELRLWLFDRNHELERASFDAAIHAGDGQWSGLDATFLFPEIVVPVATPEVAVELGLESTTPARDLLDRPLVHLDDVDRSWMSWSDWFAHHGVEAPPVRGPVVYNNYALVLQTTLAGGGVALAWRFMVDDLLAQGRLVAVGPEARHPTTAWYLLAPPERRPGELSALTDWLIDLIGG